LLLVVAVVVLLMEAAEELEKDELHFQQPH
jgi:hypothetical protein